MKYVTMFVISATLVLSAQGQAHERAECSTGSERGRCKALPAPPTPPAPPPIMGASIPLPPPPPAPPLPPEPPRVPESAHAACAGKAVGTVLTLTPKKGVTMTGSCEQDARGMYFDVTSMQDRS
ncbi:hypothetical protein KY495_16100 [Massilia sp. PAMC28688]|uniref:hypothetical protein n=1 Tax=Massilia sp. PAMC28688 TaxID=2861283 RepID=UPI001C632A7F|nr:hypothetical protein [Massilia sp. PAMC28688]QYF92272.1 hypothetical protein KY495_16100 [Massilia sp. PAMC28688]